MGVGSLRPAVFFDRDGVLNEATVRDGVPRPPQSLDELRVISSARDAVAAVRAAGFVPVIVTNQPDVARSTQRIAVVEALNEAVTRAVGIEATYVCVHDDTDGCDCRKPKPGLLLRAARDHGLSLSESYLIGDRQKDMVCGRAAGCTTVFIDRGYDETPADVDADFKVATIAEAVRCILDRERSRP